ncbi:DNA gyrase inhibitor YacG [Sphingoaurantiacus capsulatus]|uniref:DNA gyrase inhibitor YacG n=1 Tax=Sphingoaurantiacus capsulatus TaxID=1771310 RepID=A0ABV7XH03_9SPHN
MSAPAKCPLCRKPASDAHAPFCSAGCQDRDLLNWLGEAYAVSGPPADEPESLLDKR